MNIMLRPLTSYADVLRAARSTVPINKYKPEWTDADYPSDAWIRNMLRAGHSPIRVRLYRIDMIDIPSYVSVHYVRHKIGVEHFVSTNRSDRTGSDEIITRASPVNHCMVANAQALINMAKDRLCRKASAETTEVMDRIQSALKNRNDILAEFLSPHCVWLGFCKEEKPCGYCNGNIIYDSERKLITGAK